MPSWKKVIVSGSQAHLSGITSSVLSDNNLLIANPGGAIANSGLTYNGTTLAIGSANITSIGTNSILTGSFSGSFAGTFTGNLNSVILANDNNGRQYSTNGGTTASLNTITFRDTDTTSDVTQSIGRIAFESSDTDTSGSNNSQLVRAFIEAVSEDTSPDTFLAFGTALSGSLAQERMRINASGSVGIGVTAPTNTLQVGLGGITTTNLTASGNISSSGNLSITGTSTLTGATTIGGTLGVTGVTTLTGRLQANGAITTTNLTASGNISSSAGLIGNTLTIANDAAVGKDLTVTTNATVGGTLSVTGGTIATTAATANLLNTNATTINFGGAATTMAIGASNGTVTVAGNLSVNGNTTIGNAVADTASITAGRVNISNLPGGSSELAVLVTGSGGQVFTRAIDNRVFGTSLVDATNGDNNRIATFTDADSITGESNLTFDGTTFAVSTGFTATTAGVVNAASITTTGNVVVGGDLTVNGDTTIINTSTLSVEDKFIVLGRSSGSQIPASEGGIIVEGAAGSGSAFVFNSGSGGTNGLANRWGVALGVPTGSMNVTPTDFMVTVSSSGVSPTDSNPPTFGSASFGYGNMHINTTDGEIWIYS